MSASDGTNGTKSLYGDKEKASEVRSYSARESSAVDSERTREWGAVFRSSSFPDTSHPRGHTRRLTPPFHVQFTIIQFWVQKYERDARKNWDVFYKNNGDRFFKDRHYFRREWARVFPAAAAGDDVNDDSSDSDDSDSDVDPLEKAGNVERIKTNDEEPIEVGPAPRYAIPDTLIPPFPGRVFLEIGCGEFILIFVRAISMTSCLSFTGVGNSAFPLLDLDPTATVYCCDFSQRAVSLVESTAGSIAFR